VKLVAGIVLLVVSLGSLALVTLLAWAHWMFTVGYNGSLFGPIGVIAVLAGSSAYFGARLVFAWLREAAARQAAKIEQF
jgi:hypothetical protein